MTRDLVRAGLLEDDVEGGLLFDGSCGGAATSTGCRDGDRSSGADAPLVFELFDEVSDFQDGKSAELFDECACICHISIFCGIVAPRSFGRFQAGSRRTDEEPFVVWFSNAQAPIAAPAGSSRLAPAKMG